MHVSSHHPRLAPRLAGIATPTPRSASIGSACLGPTRTCVGRSLISWFREALTPYPFFTPTGLQVSGPHRGASRGEGARGPGALRQPPRARPPPSRGLRRQILSPCPLCALSSSASSHAMSSPHFLSRIPRLGSVSLSACVVGVT